MKRCLALAVVAAVGAFVAARLLVRPVGAPPTRVSWQDGADYEGYRKPSRVEAEWRENRGHAFSLKDRDETGVPKLRPAPAGCLECHAAGGASGARSYYEARAAGAHPIGCGECHEPGSAALRVARPALLAGRTGDPRALVCAQCHGEYYFAGGRVARPWSLGLRVEEIERHYDALGYSDGEDPETGAALVAIRHPQFEMWSQGVHAASGVACADCHMPRVRRGAMRVTDHTAARPLGRQACLACHTGGAGEMQARAEAIQRRTDVMTARATAAVAGLAAEVRAAIARGASPAALKHALAMHRKARLRLDFVRADGSRGFHAPQEALRLLAEAIDYARQGQIVAVRVP